MDRGVKFFLPVSITADVVVFMIENKDLRVLLIRRRESPFRGFLALPGGFVQQEETSSETAERVLQEKAGVKSMYMEQLYTFDALKRDPRGRIVTIAYFAFLSRDRAKMNLENLQEPAFFSVKKLPKLAFDHKNIIHYALRRLRAKLEYTNIVYALLPSKFTFLELQNTYETIWNKKLDKRNFRKKIHSLGLMRPAHQKKSGLRQRPAELYEFREQKPIELKKFF